MLSLSQISIGVKDCHYQWSLNTFIIDLLGQGPSANKSSEVLKIISTLKMGCSNPACGTCKLFCYCGCYKRWKNCHRGPRFLLTHLRLYILLSLVYLGSDQGVCGWWRVVHAASALEYAAVAGSVAVPRRKPEKTRHVRSFRPFILIRITGVQCSFI